MGRPVAITKVRGEPIELADHSRLVVTIHPSYLLRIREEADKRAEYSRFIKDLRVAGSLMMDGRPQVAGWRRTVSRKLAFTKRFTAPEHSGTIAFGIRLSDLEGVFASAPRE